MRVGPVMRRDLRRNFRTELWAFVVLIAVIEAAALLASPLTVPIASIIPAAIFVASSGVLASRQGQFDQAWLKRLIDFFEVFALFGAISLLGCVASYLIAAATHGYADQPLAQIDEAIGFDWPAAYRLTMESSVVQQVGRTAYSGGMLVPVLFLPFLCLVGRGDEARRFVLVFGIALALTMVMFALLPAAGPAVQYHLSGGPYAPQTGLEQKGLIDSLRSGAVRQIDLEHLHGLVSFPSFHAATATLLLWAAPSFGLLRRPLQLFILCMLAATPVEGNHYLVDLFAGAGNAFLAIRLAQYRGWAVNPDWRRLLPSRGSSPAAA